MGQVSRQSEHSFRRHWFLPIAFLTSVALALFFGLYALDPARDETPSSGLLRDYFSFDAERLTDAVASLAGIIAAVFGIVITVVSIIVQLAADRFAGVTRMFLRDRVTLGIASFYIVACVCGVWLSVSMRGDHVPRVALAAMLVATTAGLVLMAPYFGYVFRFLDPVSIIERIRRAAEERLRRVSEGKSPCPLSDAQARIVEALEELTDITNNSVVGKDKLIAGGAVDALRDFALCYGERKASLPDAWFALGARLKGNPDVVAMAPESLAELQVRCTWVEWKVLRQYLSIFNEALAHAKDIDYIVAINTRYIAEHALNRSDVDVLRLALRSMNSYLRAALNSRDVRTAYNVLNQYRLLVETMLHKGAGAHAREGVEYMVYYGHVSFDMNLSFVTETVAYDVAALCQVAYECQGPDVEVLLALLLDLDRPLTVKRQERALLGVRKAQVKLAAFFLAEGRRELAKRIAEDMAGEPLERLTMIRRSLERGWSKEFWEFTDRGTNFEYMVEAHRLRLGEFFEWLGEVPGACSSEAAPHTSR